MHKNSSASRDRLCSFSKAARQIAVSVRTLRRMVASDAFPPPISVGKRAVRFRQSDIDTFIAKGGAK